jgi:AmmeMemoRadiSam system protein B
MLTKSIREPAVAGRFYPSGKESLKELIDEIYSKEKSKIDFSLAEKEILGAVVPHAGYVYSAYQAVHFFALLESIKSPVETFVIINPNHTGYGESISLDSHEQWNTPFGNIEQDKEFISELNLPFSNIAHQNEHSGEVMLPLLQHFNKGNFKVVMITLSQQNSQNAELLASRIDSAAKKLSKNIMLIASSDFTHFKDVTTSKTLDNLVLEQIEKKDVEGVEKVVRQYNISVCGFGPIMCLMEYAKLQGGYTSK